MDIVQIAAKILVDAFGPEEAVKKANELVRMDRVRVREALRDIRVALVECEALTAGEFGCREASRAADVLERAVHALRCAANSMLMR